MLLLPAPPVPVIPITGTCPACTCHCLRNVDNSTSLYTPSSKADMVAAMFVVSARSTVVGAPIEFNAPDEWSPAARAEAAIAVGERGHADADTVQRLVELLDQPPPVGPAALWALGRLGRLAEPSANVLFAVLRDPSRNVLIRGSAALAIARGGLSAAARSRLAEEIEQADPLLRLFLEEALRN